MHKHFSHAHILSYGNGNWTYDNTDITKAEQQGIEINWENPPFTDTFNTPESTATEGSYMVIRYQSTQPATELIHCHIWSHQGKKLKINLKLPNMHLFYRYGYELLTCF